MFILWMFKEGVKGYFLKDIYLKDLENVLIEVIECGFYYLEMVINVMVNFLYEEVLDLELEFNKNEF